jgi:hypothetical protein
MRTEDDVGEGIIYHEDTGKYSIHGGTDVKIDIDDVPVVMADEHVKNDPNIRKDGKEAAKDNYLFDYYQKSLVANSKTAWGDHTPFDTEIGLYKGWFSKPNGAKLDSSESKLQILWGSGEMVVGAIGGVGGLEVSGGTSIFAGLYLMADGGYLIGQGTGGIKVNPGTMFLMLTNPVISDSKKDPFTNPFF